MDTVQDYRSISVNRNPNMQMTPIKDLRHEDDYMTKALAKLKKNESSNNEKRRTISHEPITILPNSPP